MTQARTPTGERVTVPPRYWEDLNRMDLQRLCENALAKPHEPEGLVIPFLGQGILVDRAERCLKRPEQGRWERIRYPLMELLFLVYLIQAGPEPVCNDLISAKELKTAHFFQGPHELDLGGLVERFGNDREGFQRAAESLAGETQNLADVAYRFPAFPKVPLFYLLWEGDEEFGPRFSVLFDRSVESHLSADAIWGLVNLVSEALIRAPDNPF